MKEAIDAVKAEASEFTEVVSKKSKKNKKRKAEAEVGMIIAKITSLLNHDCFLAIREKFWAIIFGQLEVNEMLIS